MIHRTYILSTIFTVGTELGYSLLGALAIREDRLNFYRKFVYYEYYNCKSIVCGVTVISCKYYYRESIICGVTVISFVDVFIFC